VPLPVHVICEHCGHDAQFIEDIAAIGKFPGRRFYQCTRCDRLAWRELSPTPQLSPVVASET
jgi:hypothetical protein